MKELRPPARQRDEPMSRQRRGFCSPLPWGRHVPTTYDQIDPPTHELRTTAPWETFVELTSRLTRLPLAWELGSLAGSYLIRDRHSLDRNPICIGSIRVH